MGTYAMPNFHFQVQWGGSRMGFQEVKNLTVGVEVIEYREGISPDYGATKMPGRPYYDNIILKRGVVKADNEFFEWFNSIKMNVVERRDITISLLDEEHNPILNWKVKNAFPVKLEWADLKSAGNEVMIESLEIATDGITVSMD